MAMGIDGFCCEEADRIRAKKPSKKINYAGIAVKGMLYKFSPRRALVVVDGKKYKFEGPLLRRRSEIGSRSGPQLGSADGGHHRLQVKAEGAENVPLLL